MTDLSKKSIYSALELIGFIPASGRSNLFVTDAESPVSPAFSCIVLRKLGKVAYSGGIGMFFTEFEKAWSDSLSVEERKIDATLPIIMSLENFEYLIERRVLAYTNDFDEVLAKARYIYQLCSTFPSSLNEFDTAIRTGELGGKLISNFLHIFDYHNDSNLYFRKSASFIRWFCDKWPDMASSMRACLTVAQQRRLGLNN